MYFFRHVYQQTDAQKPQIVVVMGDEAESQEGHLEGQKLMITVWFWLGLWVPVVQIH